MNFTTEFDAMIKRRDFNSHLPAQEEIAEHLRQDSIKPLYSELALSDQLRDKIIQVMSTSFARAYADPVKVSSRVTFQLTKLKDPTLSTSPEKFTLLKHALVVTLLKFAEASSTPDPELEGLSGNEAAFLQQQKYALQRQLDEQRRQKLDMATSTTTTTAAETTNSTTTTVTELTTATETTATTATMTAATSSATTTETTATTTTDTGATPNAVTTIAPITAEATTATIATVENTATATTTQLTVAVEDTTAQIEVQKEDESTEESREHESEIVRLFKDDVTRFDENGVAIKPSDFIGKLDSPSCQKREAWIRCINNRTPPAPIEQLVAEQEVQA